MYMYMADDRMNAEILVNTLLLTYAPLSILAQGKFLKAYFVERDSSCIFSVYQLIFLS